MGSLLGIIIKTSLPLMKNIYQAWLANNLKWINKWYNENKSIKDASLLTKGDNETVKNKAVEKDQFLIMLLGTIDNSLLGNLWTGKGVEQSKISSRGVM